MSEWQPIETAPRDGTRIIVGSFRGYGHMGWVSNAHWFDRGNDERGRYCGWTDGFDTLCYPTHWQPLVPPAGAPAMTAPSEFQRGAEAMRQAVMELLHDRLDGLSEDLNQAANSSEVAETLNRLRGMEGMEALDELFTVYGLQDAVAALEGWSNHIDAIDVAALEAEAREAGDG